MPLDHGTFTETVAFRAALGTSSPHALDGAKEDNQAAVGVEATIGVWLSPRIALSLGVELMGRTELSSVEALIGPELQVWPLPQLVLGVGPGIGLTARDAVRDHDEGVGRTLYPALRTTLRAGYAYTPAASTTVIIGPFVEIAYIGANLFGFALTWQRF